VDRQPDKEISVQLFKHSSRGNILFLISLLLASCGGGGSSPPPATVAPSDLQYPSAPAFTVHVAIDTLTPTVTGQVTGYGVSPALPAGLSFNSSSGAISGTPTAIAPKTTYTVTAKNSGGSTTASLSLAVNDVAPSISYPSPSYGFTAGVATQTITPTHSGGAVVSWSVTPGLPPGLTLSTANGNITGIPTAAAALSSYVVTAANSGGQSLFSLSLGVAAAPLLDLGHSAEVVLMRTTATDLLSLDLGGHWVLQNIVSGTTLASGDGACGTAACPQNTNNGITLQHLPVDVAGGTMIDVAAGGLEVRSATDGHVLATLPGQFSWYQLASDGSYVTAGNATALTAWTTSGVVIFSRTGNYSTALTFSAPGQVQVALGAAGTNVIETISTATGTSTLSPSFQGTFNSWFSDGARFLTSLGTTVWTYSSTATQQDITQVSTVSYLAGEGNWFWTFDPAGPLNVYQVGASTSPAFSANFSSTDSLIFPSATTLGLTAQGSGQVTVIDLSGSTPASATYTVPTAYVESYAATTAAAWFTGNSYGVVLDGASLSGQPRYLTPGAAFSITGGTGYFSIATASGEIFNYSAATDALVGTIAFSGAQLAMSSDGTVLAALEETNYSTGGIVNLYSLPSGSQTNTYPYATSMSMSGGGTVLAELNVNAAPSCTGQAFSATSGSSIWCGVNSSFLAPQVSPDGTLIASPVGPGDSTDSTNIYKNGVLVTAVPGWAIGWLDNGRLLAIIFSVYLNYTGSVIYDPLGNVLATSPIPDIYAFNVATTNSIYSPELNQILSLTTGAPTWVSGNASLTQSPYGVSQGAITGSQVIFTSGSLVLAQPY
jgi:Putative Ig domain